MRRPSTPAARCRSRTAHRGRCPPRRSTASRRRRPRPARRRPDCPGAGDARGRPTRSVARSWSRRAGRTECRSGADRERRPGLGQPGHAREHVPIRSDQRHEGDRDVQPAMHPLRDGLHLRVGLRAQPELRQGPQPSRVVRSLPTGSNPVAVVRTSTAPPADGTSSMSPHRSPRNSRSLPAAAPIGASTVSTDRRPATRTVGCDSSPPHACELARRPVRGASAPDPGSATAYGLRRTATL